MPSLEFLSWISIQILKEFKIPRKRFETGFKIAISSRDILPMNDKLVWILGINVQFREYNRCSTKLRNELREFSVLRNVFRPISRYSLPILFSGIQLLFSFESFLRCRLTLCLLYPAQYQGLYYLLCQNRNYT